MKSSTFTLDTADGTPVHVYRWEPDNQVRGVIQIAHGNAEHAGRYEHVANALTARGWAVYADDHRGHGQTAAADADGELGLFAEDRGWARVLDDLRRLTGVAREEHPGVPIVLYGHSGGAVFAQQYLFTFPDDVDGAVLSGVPVAPGLLGKVAPLIARAERARLGKRGHTALMSKLAFGPFNKRFEPTRTEFDWLSRDPTAVDAYVADPACGFDYTTQMWIDALAAIELVAKPELQAGVRDDLPVYVFAGDRDPVAGNGKAVTTLVEAYERAGVRSVTHRLYPGGRHEMVNEINRDQVIGDLLSWLESTFPDPATA